MGPYAGIDYITSPYVHSRVDPQSPDTFTMVNPMTESTLSHAICQLFPPSQGLWIWPLIYLVTVNVDNV
jgi:hypothetical protein